MAKKDPSRIGIVYSTKPDFEYQTVVEAEVETLEISKQNLKICLDKKARAGKKVTIVYGFVGKTSDLTELAKIIKTKCSVGGSVKDGEIVIQGDLRDRILGLLLTMSYKCKLI